MGLKPYLQLVRLPNLFTAAADPIAGFLLVGGALADTRLWLPLALAGVAIYAAGMVLNDVFDYHIDLVERPKRPLPSGLIPRGFATILGFGLLLIGCWLANLVGTMSLVTVLVLSSCVLAYDIGLKHTWLGPEVMGLCRSLNLLLGMSLTPHFGGPLPWLAATMFGLFVVGVTWISRNEVQTGRSRSLMAGLMVEVFALLGIAFATFMFGYISTNHVTKFLVGIGMLGIVTWVIVSKGLHAYMNPLPMTLQKAVKTGVLSLVWLDVSLVASARGLFVALAVAGLWLPAFLLGKWLYST